MSGENQHKGHRERLKNQFLENGLDGFQEHQILELLLFYSIPQRDTNVLAHTLIDTFGTLSGVFEASFEDLIAVKGVKANTATLIKMIPEIYRQYSRSKVEGKSFNKPSTAKKHIKENYLKYIKAKMVAYNQEIFMVLCLDNSNRIINSNIISKGNLIDVNVNPRDIAEVAFRNNATNLIIAHNHPSGMAFPSEKDIDFTKYIVNLLRTFQLQIRDHVIFSETDIFSMYEHPTLKKLFETEEEKTQKN